MRTLRAAVLVLARLVGRGADALCPFCSAPEPTWAERRDDADLVAIAEATDDERRVVVHRLLRGTLKLDEVATLLKSGPPLVGRSLGVALGKRDAEGVWIWDWLNVDETRLAYIVRAPATKLPSAERLPYFIAYLEHADDAIAADAYAEFGRAPFEAVEAVAPRVPMVDVRTWLVAPGVPDDRKGLYGLLLGLATREADRTANRHVLEAWIDRGETDFRAGFDGVLGGYLHLTGLSGLEQIEQRILNSPTARRGDVMHAQTALRVYHEFGRQIPKPRLSAAMARLLTRPETATAAIIDLARWEAWEQLPSIVAQWNVTPVEADRDRAIVGFLTHCPHDEAAQALVQLRRAAPERVKTAEESLRRVTIRRS